MFTLIRTIGIPATARQELIPFVAAFLIAEIYYKFGSFTLEMAAFIATWAAFGFLQSLIVRMMGRQK